MNGDGVVDWLDAGAVQDALETPESSEGDSLLADPRAFEAADVFPMLDGNAIGDGSVDALDLLLLEDVADDTGHDDADGDGIASIDENALNQLLWMTLVGRPRHGPLTRWADACLAVDGPFPLGMWFLVEEGGLSLEFCSRDGSPWSRVPALSPEEVAVSAAAPQEEQLQGVMAAALANAAHEPDAAARAPPAAPEQPDGSSSARLPDDRVGQASAPTSRRERVFEPSGLGGGPAFRFALSLREVRGPSPNPEIWPAQLSRRAPASPTVLESGSEDTSLELTPAATSSSRLPQLARPLELTPPGVGGDARAEPAPEDPLARIVERILGALLAAWQAFSSMLRGLIGR